MDHGLKKRDIDNISKAVRQTPEVEQVIIFGSRAKGNSKAGSDVDLAVKGENVTSRTIAKLRTLLEEELPLPYFFDVLQYEKINNKELIDHIDRVGKIIYNQESADLTNNGK